MKKFLLFGVNMHQNVQHESQNDLGLSVFKNCNWNCQIPTHNLKFHLVKELIHFDIYIYRNNFLSYVKSIRSKW